MDEVIFFSKSCVTHQGLAGTLENKAHILTGPRLELVPTDETEVVRMLDALQQTQNQSTTPDETSSQQHRYTQTRRKNFLYF